MTIPQRALHAYVGVIVVAAGLALLGLRVVEPVAPARLTALALVPLFALSEVFVVHFQARRSSHTFSLVEIPLVIGLLFVSPIALVVAHLVGGGSALAFHRGQRSLKLVFNMASFVVQDAAAVACFTALARDGRSDQPRTWFAVGAGCAIASVASIVLVSGAIRLAGDGTPSGERAQAILFGLAATSITTSTALALAILADRHGPAAVLVVLPIIAIYLAHRTYVQARQERRHVDALHDAAQLLTPDRPAEIALHELVRRAQDVFAVEAAVLVFRRSAAREASGLIVTSDVDRIVAAATDPGRWLDAVGELLATRASRIVEGPGRNADLTPVSAPIPVRNAMAVALHPGDGSSGYLAVLNRLGDIGRFSADDLRVLETMGRQIANAVATEAPDVSSGELRVLEAEMRYRERHDGLTGLANRAGFFDHLGAALASADEPTGTSLLVVDIDIAVTDDDIDVQQLDVVLAHRLRRCVRDRDEVARLGRGRFVLAARTPGGHPEAQAVAERVRCSLRATVHVDGVSLTPIVHIGVSGVIPGGSGESMLAAAEMALDMARQSNAGIQIVELA